MPSAAALRARRTLVLTGSGTGQVRGPAFEFGDIDETVTQTAVVTPTRLAS